MWSVTADNFNRSSTSLAVGHDRSPTGHQQERLVAGQKLGIKEVDDGIWLVSFMHYDLGYIDLEQKTLQTIDNPFGSRLSPMS